MGMGCCHFQTPQRFPGGVTTMAISAEIFPSMVRGVSAFFCVSETDVGSVATTHEVAPKVRITIEQRLCNGSDVLIGIYDQKLHIY